MKRGWWIGKFIVLGLVMLALIGLITMTLWNWLVPVLFAGPVIGFWQALGLLALSKILFWTFSRGRCGHSYGGHWKPYWRQRWSNMTPEEREKLKARMKEKWCSWEETPSAKESDTSNV